MRRFCVNETGRELRIGVQSARDLSKSATQMGASADGGIALEPVS
jgi:hypothetical protein